MPTKRCLDCGKEINPKDKRTVYCPKVCGKRGERGGGWKGDAVGKDALHSYIRKLLPKTDVCQHCKKVPPIDLANKSNEYKRDVSDWEWLCRKCHMKSDGRLEKFLQHSNMHNKIPNKNCLQCGGVFTPKYKSRRFCSKSCSTTYNNLRIDYSKRKKPNQLLIALDMTEK